MMRFSEKEYARVREANADREELQEAQEEIARLRTALAEAQRERDEARAEASKWKHLCSGAVRLKRVRDARLDAIRQALEQNKDDALVRVEARWLVDCAQSEIEFPERQRREELDTAVDRAIREARRGHVEGAEGRTVTRSAGKGEG